MKATKKELAKHLGRKQWREVLHSEGNCFCDCMTRNFRLYMGLKLHGPVDVKEEFDSVRSEGYNRGGVEERRSAGG